MAKVYTVGVIGAGRIGKIHIENILRNIPDLKLKLVADIKAGFDDYKSFQEFLKENLLRRGLNGEN